MNKTYDLFSNKGQGGEHYMKYRISYPDHFIEKLSKLCNGKESYLDIAAGTGQLFLKLYHHFNKLVVANELSSLQLDVLKSNYDGNINAKFIHSDCLEIANHLNGEKFDVITIGVAFHWLDCDRALEYIKNELLNENGVLIIVGYYFGSIKSELADDELNNKLYDMGFKFLEKVQADIDYADKLDILYNDYKSCRFDKYFTNINYDKWIESTLVTWEQYAGHLRSGSGVPIYIKKHQNDENYKDPVDEHIEDLRKCLMKDDFDIIVMHPYFCYMLYN